MVLYNMSAIAQTWQLLSRTTLSCRESFSVNVLYFVRALHTFLSFRVFELRQGNKETRVRIAKYIGMRSQHSCPPVIERLSLATDWLTNVSVEMPGWWCFAAGSMIGKGIGS